jgi:tetratricopeptide (TPR) repeat protein
VAGNRQVFEQAMRQGTNYAWDRQWDKAIAEYQRAVAEFPNEAPAYTALGQALVYADQHNEALRVYQRAARLTPEDPLALARVAELQEQTDDLAGAVKTWLHTADLHLRRRSVDIAVQVWQHLVEVAPQTAAAHERLAKAYAGMEQTRKAVRQYLHLAAVYQTAGQDEKAQAACQKALKLDPRDQEILKALEALQQGQSLAELVEVKRATMPYSGLEAGSEEQGRAINPVEMARQQALAKLADALLDDVNVEDVALIGALMQAVDCQTRGETEAAIQSYETAIEQGVGHAAAHFNLGLLYQEHLEFQDAIQQFERAVTDEDYALGADFALGECWRALGRIDQAAVHFMMVLQRLDLSTASPEHAVALQRTYQGLIRHIQSHDGDGTVGNFINALVDFLSGENWEERVLQTRHRLDRLGGDRVISLAEIVTLPDSEQVLSSMIKSKEYLEEGMLRSASEECLWAIEHVPDYLPLHLHLAQLFMQGNQLNIGISKYLFVADTYVSRGETEEARGLYEAVLRVAPMDLDVRQKLIALLKKHGMIEQALEHQLALADAYYELAQIEASRERYGEALHLAARLTNGQKWTAQILHRLGDIDLQRLDWRAAVKVYLQLKTTVPEDIRARQRLVELYFNLQRRPQAVAELDEMINRFREQRDLLKALQAVEELVSSRPEELELRKRAAQLSVETGNKEGAVKHLDAMGELQLQSGRVREAKATIKAIVALGPANVEAYRQLLEQIE